MEEEFTRSYNGFSGVDITLYTSETPRREIAKIQAISMSKTKPMAPIFEEFAEPEVTCIAGSLLSYEDFDCPNPKETLLEIEIRANEDGREARMYIVGIKILEEGFAVEKVKASEQQTYIAVDILPWRWSDGKEFKTEERVQEKCE